MTDKKDWITMVGTNQLFSTLDDVKDPVEVWMAWLQAELADLDTMDQVKQQVHEMEKYMHNGIRLTREIAFNTQTVPVTVDLYWYVLILDEFTKFSNLTQPLTVNLGVFEPRLRELIGQMQQQMPFYQGIHADTDGIQALLADLVKSTKELINVMSGRRTSFRISNGLKISDYTNRLSEYTEKLNNSLSSLESPLVKTVKALNPLRTMHFNQVNQFVKEVEGKDGQTEKELQIGNLRSVVEELRELQNLYKIQTQEMIKSLMATYYMTNDNATKIYIVEKINNMLRAEGVDSVHFENHKAQFGGGDVTKAWETFLSTQPSSAPFVKDTKDLETLVGNMHGFVKVLSDGTLQLIESNINMESELKQYGQELASFRNDMDYYMKVLPHTLHANILLWMAMLQKEDNLDALFKDEGLIQKAQDLKKASGELGDDVKPVDILMTYFLQKIKGDEFKSNVSWKDQLSSIDESRLKEMVETQLEDKMKSLNEKADQLSSSVAALDTKVDHVLDTIPPSVDPDTVTKLTSQVQSNEAALKELQTARDNLERIIPDYKEIQDEVSKLQESAAELEQIKNKLDKFESINTTEAVVRKQELEDFKQGLIESQEKNQTEYERLLAELRGKIDSMKTEMTNETDAQMNTRLAELEAELQKSKHMDVEELNKKLQILIDALNTEAAATTAGGGSIYRSRRIIGGAENMALVDQLKENKKRAVASPQANKVENTQVDKSKQHLLDVEEARKAVRKAIDVVDGINGRFGKFQDMIHELQQDKDNLTSKKIDEKKVAGISKYLEEDGKQYLSNEQKQIDETIKLLDNARASFTRIIHGDASNVTYKTIDGIVKFIFEGTDNVDKLESDEFQKVKKAIQDYNETQKYKQIQEKQQLQKSIDNVKERIDKLKTELQDLVDNVNPNLKQNYLSINVNTLNKDERTKFETLKTDLQNAENDLSMLEKKEAQTINHPDVDNTKLTAKYYKGFVDYLKGVRTTIQDQYTQAMGTVKKLDVSIKEANKSKRDLILNANMRRDKDRDAQLLAQKENPPITFKPIENLQVKNEIEYITSLLEIFYEQLKEVEGIVQRTGSVSYVSSMAGEPSLFLRLFNNYNEIKAKEKTSFIATETLVNQMRANDLIPREVLKLSTSDRVIFFFTILFLRLFVLSLCSFMIERGWIKQLSWALLIFLVLYTIFYIGLVYFINRDAYRLRIIFNYVNLHANSRYVYGHAAYLWMFSLLIFFIMWNINFPIQGVKTVAISDEEKVELIYRLEVITMIIWIFLSISVVLT